MISRMFSFMYVIFGVLQLLLIIVVVLLLLLLLSLFLIIIIILLLCIMTKFVTISVIKISDRICDQTFRSLIVTKLFQPLIWLLIMN